MAAEIHIKTLASSVVTEAASERRGRFSPYVNNGGTTLGVAGDDYAIIAGDTRMSNGYSICSRDVPKIFSL
jgi:20S proteasome subunit beta 6